MTLKDILVANLGAEKTKKLFALTGSLIIGLLASFPMSMLIQLLGLDAVWSGWLTYAWGLVLLYIDYMVILFLGKSDEFPPAPLPIITPEIEPEPFEPTPE